jgi:hypothetical protein
MLAAAATLLVAGVLGGCYGATTTAYVGVSGPGPWYGYPYPGRYPGPYGPYGGGFVGVTICCEEEEEEQQQQGMSLPGAPEEGPESPLGPRADDGGVATAQ